MPTCRSRRKPTSRTRVLLADDHAVLRAGLRLLLDSQVDIEVCGEASTGEQAVSRVRELAPDVVVMDLRMSGLDGIEATRKICASQAAPRVLILSMYDDPEFMDQALAAGAAGYALKKDADTDLLTAIRALAQGHSYLAPSLTTVALRRLTGKEQPPGAGNHDLSPRELDVLRQLALGFTNRQIAEALSLSIKTVETYKARIMEKLGVSGRAALVRYAIAQGLMGTDT